ncbi:MAG: hypothetical protein ACI81V_000670 [Lentimonas sp.]|jgi:hypothetical protein
MRTPRHSSPAPSRLLIWLFSFALFITSLVAEDDTDTTAAPKNSSLTLDVTGANVNGSETAWRARQNYTKGLRGGIRSLHLEEALGDEWTLEMDARATLDQDEYIFETTFEKSGGNRTTIGFERYRYWSDARTTGISGSPLLEPFDPSLHLDRSKFFIETTFFPTDVFDFTFRYTYREREGDKASTSWGDSVYNDRKTTPSFWGIDEEHHTVELEAERRWDQTTVETTLRWDHTELNNSLNFIRGYDDPGTERYYTQIEENESDNLSARGIIEHRVSEILLFNISGMYSRLDGDLGGSRIIDDMFYGSYVSGIQNYANPQQRDHGFFDLAGDYDLYQYVTTFSALYQPADHWFITPSIRFETTSSDVSATESETEIPGGGAVIAGETDLSSRSKVDYDSVAAEIGARYTGITNWTLYAEAYASYGVGDHFETQFDITDPLNPDVDRNTDYDRTDTKFTLGANWYAHPKVTIAMQSYYKTGDNDYEHQSLDSDDYSAYIIKQNRDTLDLNLRVNWRVFSNLTSVSRFDYQQSTIDTQVFGKSILETADRERFSYGQSLTYQASARLTLLTNLNYVNDRLTGPASDLYSSQDTSVVAESNMDYFYGQVTGLYAYSDTLDLTVSVGSLLSDNDYDNSAVSVPYGNNIAEYHLSAGLTKMLAPSKRLTLQYGYYDYEDKTLDGDGDFTAHVLSAQYEYRF